MGVRGHQDRGQVSHLHDLRHCLPVYRRVVPHQSQKFGCWFGLNFCPDRIHISTVHCRSLGFHPCRYSGGDFWTLFLCRWGHLPNLPETLNKRMPESVADVERAGRRRKGQEPEEMNAVAPPAEEAGGGEKRKLFTFCVFTEKQTNFQCYQNLLG